MTTTLTLILLACAAQDDIRVTTDRTVDARSLETIVRDVWRLAEAKTNDEKAIAIHTWLHQAIFHHAYPVEKAPQSVGPLKVLNVYGWGLCGGQHTVLKALFEAAGWSVRYRGWSNPGHTTVEVFYDDRWHYFDVFLKCYFWTKDRKTIAGQDDIVKDPSIVLDALKENRVPAAHYLCCGDDAEGVVQGCRNSKALPTSKPQDGWASVTGRDQGYAPTLRLPNGASLRLEWDGAANATAVAGKALHTCGNKDFRADPVLGPLVEHYGARDHSNGQFEYAPDFARPDHVADLALTGVSAKAGKLVGSGAAVFKAGLPYVYVTAELEAAFEGGEGKLSISTDGGKTWTPAAVGDVSATVKQRYDVWLKAEFSGALAQLRFKAVVEHNRGVLPHLLPGANKVTVAADRPVSVTYAFQEATVSDPAKRKRWDGQGVTYGEKKTRTLQARKGSHAETIDVGGNTPPKMLYLEISAGRKS